MTFATRSSSATAAAAALCAALALCPRLAHADCSTDMDCKGQRVCVQGQCVDPPPGSAATIAAPATAAPALPPSAHGLVYVDTSTQTAPPPGEAQWHYAHPGMRGWGIGLFVLGVVLDVAGTATYFGGSSAESSYCGSGNSGSARRQRRARRRGPPRSRFDRDAHGHPSVGLGQLHGARPRFETRSPAARLSVRGPDEDRDERGALRELLKRSRRT